MLATLTSKGQVTIPVAVRERLGLVPGTRLDFAVTEDGRIEVTPRRLGLADLYGFVPGADHRLSVEAMGDAIGSALSDDDQRVKEQR